MTKLFWKLFTHILWAVLSLRYRIRVKGLDKLSQMKFHQKGGVLFLPNHPAHMDPLFLYILLWPEYGMRPLAIEYIYRLRILRPLMRLVKALPIPNFDTSVNQLKVKRAQESIRAIAEGLKKGENFLLYPGGRLKSGAKEVLGGSSGAQSLVEEYPEANIVLIRTTGLWGSSFSRAFLGKSPDLPATLWNGVKTIVKNFIFFTPRRDVLIEIEPDTESFVKGKTRLEFNRVLESWYNQYPDKDGKISNEEPLKVIPYTFWKSELPAVFQPKQKKGANGTSISEETRTKIYNEIRRILENPGIEISPQKSLPLDLGMDSLNIAEIITYLTQNYEVDELHPEDVETVQHVLEIAEGSRTAENPSRQLGTASFPEENGRPAPSLPEGRTMGEAFLNSCDRMGDFIACGDDLIGVLSYKKLKRAALVLACEFKKMPDEKIAIMLPASAGAFIIILAVQLAGKIPVMLNWTLGPRYLDDMMELSGAKVAISSWKFLDKLAHVDFGKLIGQLQLLEDIRQNLSILTKLKGAVLSLRSRASIARALKLDKVNENSPAVILFTSGTEASPKGVPLSHANIITNLRSAMQCIEVGPKDVFYGILPPFHSFGFSVAGIFTILTGTKIAFYPDPTDSFALAEGIERWKITFFCSAPSFLRGLLHAAKKGQLKTVRYFVSGAEKASQDLFDQVEKLGTGAMLAEGYGITECSPIITLNRLNLPPSGVGRAIPGVEICTIHLENKTLLPPGSEGEICIHGPSVFSGYLSNPRNPFIELEGKKWYRTGDIGYVDKEGSLILSGRLKRFTKIGGEMISLGAVESALVQELIHRGQISQDTPALAVIADEKEAGKPQLIVFTTIIIDKEGVNEILRNSGLSRLVKISQVRKVDEIPMLGTGKTNYRSLQSQLEEKK